MLQLSASSAALDLALSNPEQSEEWTPFARHRLSQQGLSQTMNSLSLGPSSNGTSNSDSQKSSEAMGNARLNRHSMEASLAAYGQPTQHGQVVSNEPVRPTLANIHSSYSTNDVPTLKKANGVMPNITPPKTQAQQQFHNHNASLGRIPSSAISNRHSRELSGGDARRDEQTNGYQQILSGLQASAAPFGPPTTASSPVDAMPNAMAQLNNALQFPNQGYYPAFGMQMMNMGMTPMHMANPMAFHNQMQAFQPQNGFSPYPNYGPQGRFQDSQARVIQQRRMQNGEGKSNLTLSTTVIDGKSRKCPLHQRQIRAFPRRDTRTLQRPAWVSLPAEEVRRAQFGACAADFHRDPPACCGAHDWY